MATFGAMQEQTQKVQIPHKLTLDERRKLTVSGVTEVLCFESDVVVLKTVKGTLTVRGEELKLRALTPDAGKIEVDGTIDAFDYAPIREGGFFRRLFG